MKRTKLLNRAILIVGAAIVVLALVLFVFVPEDGIMSGGGFERFEHGNFEHGFGGHAPFAMTSRGWHTRGGVLFPLLTILLLVTLSGRLFRRSHSRYHREGRSNAGDVLREKFAAGEISREEFQSRRRVLEDDETGGLS